MAAPEVTLARARYEHARVVLERVVVECRAVGVEVLPVKGIVTARLLYSDPAERPFQDVDLRIRPQDLSVVERAAARAGWPRVGCSRAYRTLAFHVLGFLVEFESHVGPPGLCALRVEEMLRRAVRGDDGSGAVGYLQPEIHDHALVLSVNAFKDKLIDAVPGAIRDLELLPRYPGFVPEKLAALAKDSGTVTIVWIVATWLAARSHGTSAWAAVVAALGRSPRRPFYATAFRRAIQSPPRRVLLRLLTRIGADRRGQRLKALAALAFRAAEDAAAWSRMANDPPDQGIETYVAGSPPAARMCSPR